MDNGALNCKLMLMPLVLDNPLLPRIDNSTVTPPTISLRKCPSSIRGHLRARRVQMQLHCNPSVSALESDSIGTTYMGSHSLLQRAARFCVRRLCWAAWCTASSSAEF